MNGSIVASQNLQNCITIKQFSVNYKKIRSFLNLKLASFEPSVESKPKKRYLANNRWRFSKKAKGLIVFAIIIVIFISIFSFLPKETPPQALPQSTDTPSPSPSPTPQSTVQPSTPHPYADLGQMFSNVAGSVVQAFSPPKEPGLIESAKTINSTIWRQVAANAWAYFQPGIGVDIHTGLPYAGSTSCPRFTDWDLGVYIQAVIDAQEINVTSTDGAWGSYARLEKVLTFLENRELNTTTGYPFWFYDAITGKVYAELPDTDVTDAGRLLIALSNLKIYNSSWAERIDNLVYNRFGNRSDYAALVPGIKNESLGQSSIYAYYVASGFASFWSNDLSDAPSMILNNMFSAGNVTTFGVSLPKAAISCDPLLCSVFELNNNDARLTALARQVYLAHEAKYNATGAFVAFSEGSSASTGFIYEWVVRPDGSTWNITNGAQTWYIDINPIIYNKVAFSFLALYNTTFARNMVVYLEQSLPYPTSGYSEGADYNIDGNARNLVSGVGSNTNGLILNAAEYAIRNNQ
jgi:hypothetical protein